MRTLKVMLSFPADNIFVQSILFYLTRNKLFSPHCAVFLFDAELYPADLSAVASVISQKFESTKF